MRIEATFMCQPEKERKREIKQTSTRNESLMTFFGNTSGTIKTYVIINVSDAFWGATETDDK